MKSSVEQINPVQYRIKVELTADEVNRAFEDVFRKIQKKARIQGFRPGKAPLNMIRKLYSAHATGEVHESLINKHLASALGEQTIRPIASPVLETEEFPQFDQQFAFSALIDTLPRMDFSDYKGLNITAEKFAVKQETVDRELATLRRRHAKMRPAEDGTRAAAAMLATVSHTATLDGNPIDRMNVAGMPVHLGEHEIFADLEDVITGMTKGETKEADITVPEDYGDSELAGKTLHFSVTLTDLQHVDTPALDDEFAKDLDFESLDALTQDVRSHLEGRAAEMSRQRIENKILDAILEKHPFEVPPVMVDQVIDSMIQELRHPGEKERQAALKNTELRQRFLETARRRTQNTLVLWHVSQTEKLEVTEDEVTNRVEESLKSFGISDPKQAAALRRNLEARVRENMIFDKAMEFLIETSNVTEIPAEI